jgi:hypothetical protein
MRNTKRHFNLKKVDGHPIQIKIYLLYLPRELNFTRSKPDFYEKNTDLLYINYG